MRADALRSPDAEGTGCVHWLGKGAPYISPIRQPFPQVLSATPEASLSPAR